jgi:hypothetical protein
MNPLGCGGVPPFGGGGVQRDAVNKQEHRSRQDRGDPWFRRRQHPETGCEIDFHYVDATTARLGLNDHVYTLKKQ